MRGRARRLTAYWYLGLAALVGVAMAASLAWHIYTWNLSDSLVWLKPLYVGLSGVGIAGCGWLLLRRLTTIAVSFGFGGWNNWGKKG